MKLPSVWATAMIVAAPAIACRTAAPATGIITNAGINIVQPGAPGQPSARVTEGDALRRAVTKSTDADVAFMQGMIHHHAQALEMTALLRARTKRDDMQLLAQRIDISQTGEMKMMREWLTDRGETVPVDHTNHGTPSPAMPGMLTSEQMAALERAKGADFDGLFLAGMIQHHQGALVMVDELFRSQGAGQESIVFDFATHVDSDQRAEIARMTKMLKTTP